ncbi:A-kinase anchor protein 8-like isoform X3 [Tachysurus vachellii]|uniref:A-kinase anchor protein 8-like isoform X3 n=1 Tax=Tachysurus vachellii TaxID=175792 RepID=UPI00296AD454|nr:A-kinase anchor protein 8-like isoform X3 [Tachysurus vachellii]
MSSFGSDSGKQDLSNTPESPQASVKTSSDDFFPTVNTLTNDSRNKRCTRYKQFDPPFVAFPNPQDPCGADDFVNDEMSEYEGIDFIAVDKLRNDSGFRQMRWRSKHRGRWAYRGGRNGHHYNQPESGDYPPHHKWHVRAGRRHNLSRPRNRPDILSESGESGPVGEVQRTFSTTEKDLGAQPCSVSRRKERAKLRKRRMRALKAAAKAQAAPDLYTTVTQQVKPKQEVKRKQKRPTSAADEPECKMIKTEPSGDSTNNMEAVERSETDGSASNPGAEEQPRGDTEETSEGSTPASASTSAEAEQSCMEKWLEETTERATYSTKQQGRRTRKYDDKQVKQGYAGRTRPEMITAQRIAFVCSVCKFRSFYRRNMTVHLKSKFHKDHFKFLSDHLPEATMDFLQAHFSNKHKKVEGFINQIQDHRATICQLYEDKDLTQDISMEHFMRKAEAAHCLACDVYIPMQHLLIQQHLKSPEHKRNCKVMMVQSIQSGLSITQNILSQRHICKKLNLYLKHSVVTDGSEVKPDEVWSSGQGAVPETCTTNQKVASLCVQENQAAEAAGDEQQSEPLCEETFPAVEKINNEDVQEEPEHSNLTKSLFDLLDEDDDVEGVELGEEEMGEDDI